MEKIVMYVMVLFVFTASPLLSTKVYAHGTDHGPSSPTQVTEPITEKRAYELATSIVESIVQKGKIDKSWLKVKPSDAVKKQISNRFEWVVSYKNPAVEDKSKQTLYVFLGITGEYLAANFTGN
jgi:hypothetical protein